MPRDNGQSILIVEEDSTFRSLIVRMLKAQGYRVEQLSASSSFNALKSNYWLVIIDTKVFKRSASESSNLIRSGSLTILTTESSKEAEALKHPVLLKPFTTAKLLDCVRDAEDIYMELEVIRSA